MIFTENLFPLLFQEEANRKAPSFGKREGLVGCNDYAWLVPATQRLRDMSQRTAALFAEAASHETAIRRTPTPKGEEPPPPVEVTGQYGEVATECAERAKPSP